MQLHPLDAARFGLTFGDLAEVASAGGAHRRASRDHGHRRAGPSVRADALGQRVREQCARRRADRAGRRPDLGPARAQGAPVRVRRYEPKWYGFALRASRSRCRLRRTAPCRAARATGATSSPARTCRRRGPSGPMRVLGAARGAHRVLGRRRRALSRRQRRGRSAPSVRVRRDREVAAVAQLARDVCSARRTLSTTPTRLAILAGRAPKGALETGPVVCSCFAVGRSTLLRAIRGDELVSVEQIGKALQRRHELRLVHSRSSRGCSPSRPRAPRRRPNLRSAGARRRGRAGLRDGQR